MDFEKVRIGDQTIKVATDDADKLIKFDSDNSANQIFGQMKSCQSSY